jgi:hypothetical protein
MPREPTVAPTAVPEATAVPPSTGVAAMLRRPEALGALGILLVLIAVVLGVLSWRGRRGAPPPPAQSKAKPGPAVPGMAAAVTPAAAAPALLLLAAAPPPGVPFLRSESRGQGPFYCPLNAGVVRVGRGADQELRIDASFTGWETVSREHATITCQGERCIVSDVGAANGVWVDGRRTGRNVLLDGATVQFGQVAFTYHANRRGGVQ